MRNVGVLMAGAEEAEGEGRDQVAGAAALVLLKALV